MPLSTTLLLCSALCQTTAWQELLLYLIFHRPKICLLLYLYAQTATIHTWYLKGNIWMFETLFVSPPSLVFKITVSLWAQEKSNLSPHTKKYFPIFLGYYFSSPWNNQWWPVIWGGGALRHRETQQHQESRYFGLICFKSSSRFHVMSTTEHGGLTNRVQWD